MSEIKIATAPCSWGVWYADTSPSYTPYSVFLDQAASAGYRGLEMGPDGYLPTDIEKLKEELKTRDLEICAGTACYAFDQYASFSDFKEPIDKLCQRLNHFNAKYLVTMDESDVGVYSEKKQFYTSTLWEKYFHMFRELGKYTYEVYNIETVFHPHIKSLIETKEEITRMIHAAQLNLCFDIGHYVYVNGGTEQNDSSAFDFIRDYKEKIAYLHFKNIDETIRKKVQKENLSSDEAFDLNVMGDLEFGIINYKEFKTVLEEIDFHGIGVIEQDIPKATTFQAFSAAKRNLEYLRKIHMID